MQGKRNNKIVKNDGKEREGGIKSYKKKKKNATKTPKRELNLSHNVLVLRLQVTLKNGWVKHNQQHTI